jgi:hypothetical protein
MDILCQYYKPDNAKINHHKAIFLSIRLMSVKKMTYYVHQLLHNDILQTIVVGPFQDSFQLICVFFGLSLYWLNYLLLRRKQLCGSLSLHCLNYLLLKGKQLCGGLSLHCLNYLLLRGKPLCGGLSCIVLTFYYWEENSLWRSIFVLS